MKLALDTHAYSDFCRGNERVKHAVRAAEVVIMPLIVLAELRAGFLAGKQGARNEGVLEQFLSQPRVRVIAPDEETTHHSARLFLHLRQQGTPVPVNELWIAALVIQHRLTLFSEDAHFENLPQVARY